ncbi:M50 family metallopeptidase [Motilimonas sp. 1_MG-2023]|uniref:M50 family metallopeptidase n=1 Tax=Motilimonas TaxID=1914248 RepID=UPI0026E38963|nr:M50 family metallopeptidase [Motilimonas sp. 1_MG-2023]MDO6526538.1 M50 family metallopeptidase [Motilimonas sp. 1_MG-2023]
MNHYRTLLTLTLVIVLYLTWNTIWVLPLKILVVYFHEFSHALMTWLTGGRVISFVVSADQSGHVISAGGSRFLILSAGYLGSILCGALLYRFSHVNNLLWLLVACFVLIGVFFFGSMFTLLFSLGGALVLGLTRYYLSLFWQQTLLQLIGLASLCYVPFDVYQDTIANAHQRSDAAMLAEEFFGFTWLWGGLWCALSVVVFCWALFKSNSRAVTDKA